MIRVLGPVDVLTPPGPVALGSRNMRALLGALVVAASQWVSSDQLEAVLWGDRPPRSARSSLQTYVSRLRHIIGTDSVRGSDHGYVLDVDRHQIDAVRFEELLTQATELRSEPQRCEPLCREALRLWHGTPFGDLAADEPFRIETIRLEELRLATLELDLEAELALGRHEIIVAELQGAVEEQPYRERFWYLLIEALLRDDRRVEALRTCSRLRDRLVEVGLEVGDELRQLEDRILAGSPESVRQSVMRTGRHQAPIEDST
jgi:DNA-binding SARP family transcriptional activator